MQNTMHHFVTPLSDDMSVWMDTLDVILAQLMYNLKRMSSKKASRLQLSSDFV